LYFFAGQLFGVTLFKENSLKKFILAVLILATITEAVQIFVPSRAFNFFDWLANVIGIVIGLIVIWGRRLRSETTNRDEGELGEAKFRGAERKTEEKRQMAESGREGETKRLRD
jgi:hypothetical protein